MFKRIIALVLCTIMCIGTAFALEPTEVSCKLDPSGNRVHIGTVPFGRARLTTYVTSKFNASSIKNIYGNSAISIHNENQILSQQEKTDHYKKDTNVSTFYDRNLSFPEIIIDLVGYGRVRHTNGQAYESTPLVCPARFGGRNFYELRPLNSLSANDESMGLGNEKANAIATVANTVFDYDFSNYNYASFYDLWTDETLPDNMATMRDILIDVFNAGKEGTHLPFGFFYNDEFAYTVVEQEDGSLALTEYSLYPSTAATVSTQSEDTSFDTPSYEVIDVEVADADHSVINIMYQ